MGGQWCTTRARKKKEKKYMLQRCIPPRSGEIKIKGKKKKKNPPFLFLGGRIEGRRETNGELKGGIVVS